MRNVSKVTEAYPRSLRARMWLIAVFASVAGMCNAMGFLCFPPLFMSFMTGNTTRLSMAISLKNLDAAIVLGTIITVFMLGTFLGTLMAAMSGRWRLGLLTLIEAILLSMAQLLPVGVYILPLHAYAVILALGLQNTILQDDHARSLSLTYVTGCVVRIGSGLANACLGFEATHLKIQFVILASFVCGTIIGVCLFNHFGEEAFLIPALVLSLLSLCILVTTIFFPHNPIISNSVAPPPDSR